MPNDKTNKEKKQLKIMNDDLKIQRFFYSVGVILLFYKGYEISVDKGSIYKIFGAAGLLTITLFLGFYLFFYGLSLTNTLREEQVKWVEDNSQNLFNAGFETAIFFMAYSLSIFIFLVALFPFRNALSQDWYFSIALILALVSAIISHLTIFDKKRSTLYDKKAMRGAYFVIISLLLIITIPSVRDVFLTIL